MKVVSTREAGDNLASLIEEVQSSHAPIQIVGSSGNAVVLSAEDWADIEETLFLSSVPGMTESIREGMQTHAEDCASDPGW